MGILDPQSQAMLAAGFAALEASGPSRTPVSFGQVVGRGGMAGLGTYQQAMESLRKLAQTDALIDLEKKRAALTEAQVQALLRKEKMMSAVMSRFMPGATLAPPAAGPVDSVVKTGEPAAPWMPPPEPSAPAQSPLSQLTPEQVFAMKLAGLGDFTELYKFQNTPQNTPAGSYVRDRPGADPRYLADPTKDPAFAGRVAGAEAEARANVELRNRAPGTFNIPGIGPVMLSGPAALDYANSGNLPGAGPAAPAPAAPGAKLIPTGGAGAIPITQPRTRPGLLSSEAALAAEKLAAEAKARAEAERPQVTGRLREGFSVLDRVSEAARELRDHPGLRGITGLYGKAPNVPGSDSADALAKLTTLQARGMIKELQAMRASSPTGSALGNVTERELEYLINAIASLDRKQGTDTFKRELNKIIRDIARAKGRMGKQFAESYGAANAREFNLSAQELEEGL